MHSGIQRMATILRESDTPQIRSDLIRFAWDTKELRGKCALGELACKSGKEELKLDIDRMYVSHHKIMKAYGVEREEYPPLLLDVEDESSSDVIAGYIVKLNDRFGFSFKEIADFLEVTFGDMEE